MFLKRGRRRNRNEELESIRLTLKKGAGVKSSGKFRFYNFNSSMLAKSVSEASSSALFQVKCSHPNKLREENTLRWKAGAAVNINFIYVCF